MRMKNIMNILRVKRVVICSLILVFIGVNSILAQKNSNDKTTAIQITGKVVDAHTKEPIAAAQISVLNFPASATTDEKGEFTIQIKDETNVLIIKAFDYNLREYPLRGNNQVSIVMYPNTFRADYYSETDFNGAVNKSQAVRSINSTSNTNQSTGFTADEVIQLSLGGNVRSITRSGTVAMGNEIFVRGLNSVFRNGQPIFVVDGIIWDNLNNAASIHMGYKANPLALIDVNDIETIRVLKDGTSIYGSKAANGVVIIETKRASDIVTKIDVNAVRGVITKPDMLPVMNADDYRIYASEIQGSNPNISARDLSQLTYLNDDPLNSSYASYHNNTNWQDEVYQAGVSQNYNINVKGGDAKALYYFSLFYGDNTGVVKNTSMERIGTRLKCRL